MKNTLLITVIFFLLKSAYCQQDPQFSHEMFNLMGSNPGFAGSSGDINATAINRQQWVGFSGAPKTTLFSIESSLSALGLKGGAGLIIVDDRIGFEKNFNAKLAYSYHKDLWSGKLGIGIEAGLANKSIDGEWKSTDPVSADVAIPTKGEHKMVFDLGLGLFYTLNNLYIGISSSHIHQPKIKFATNGETFLKRHYFLMSGYNIQVPNSLIELKPSIFVQSDGSSSQFSFNLVALYNKKFWGGVNYRNQDAIIALLGIELLSGIKLGYAYDLSISKIRKATSGTHEVMLSYSFNIGIQRTPQKYKSVRFL